MKKTHEDISGNLSQEIIDEMAGLNRKRIKKYLDSINIRVYRYTFLRRRRTDLEMLLIFTIKVLFSVLRLMKLLFSNPEQLNSNPAYKSIEWKIKNLSEALHLLEKLNIKSHAELDKKVKESRANSYQLHKEVERLTDQKRNYSALMDSVAVVKYLQSRMDLMGLTQETLGIVSPDKTVIHKNRAILDPMSPIQRRNFFLAISDSKSYRPNCKYDEITASQVDGIIDFLKLPKTKEKPDMVIFMEEFERIRKKKIQESIRKPKMGIRTSQVEADKSAHYYSEHDYLELLQKHNSEESALIWKYRDALNHLSQFEIYDINLVEKKYNDILKNLEQKKPELKVSGERQKQLFQIKSAIAFADNKQYLCGQFRKILKNEDIKDRIEIVEAAEENIQRETDLDILTKEQSIINIR